MVLGQLLGLVDPHAIGGEMAEKALGESRQRPSTQDDPSGVWGLEESPGCCSESDTCSGEPRLQLWQEGGLPKESCCVSVLGGEKACHEAVSSNLAQGGEPLQHGASKRRLRVLDRHRCRGETRGGGEGNSSCFVAGQAFDHDASARSCGCSHPACSLQVMA